MATETEIRDLRRRVEELNTRRIQEEARAAAAEQEEARLLAEAREQFGVDSLEALEALLAKEQAALDRDVAALEQAVVAAEAAAAQLPS